MPTRAKVDGQEDAIAITRAAWAQPVVRYHGRVYSAAAWPSGHYQAAGYDHQPQRMRAGAQRP